MEKKALSMIDFEFGKADIGHKIEHYIEKIVVYDERHMEIFWKEKEKT